MTTLNNDELRQQTWKVAAGILGIDDNDVNSDAIHSVAIAIQFHIDKLIATHDQQLLEAILEGIVDTKHYNGKRMVNPAYVCDECGEPEEKYIRNQRNEEIRQHIKSVFKKEGE